VPGRIAAFWRFTYGVSYGCSVRLRGRGVRATAHVRGVRCWACSLTCGMPRLGGEGCAARVACACWQSAAFRHIFCKTFGGLCGAAYYAFLFPAYSPTGLHTLATRGGEQRFSSRRRLLSVLEHVSSAPSDSHGVPGIWDLLLHLKHWRGLPCLSVGRRWMLRHVPEGCAWPLARVFAPCTYRQARLSNGVTAQHSMCGGAQRLTATRNLLLGGGSFLFSTLLVELVSATRWRLRRAGNRVCGGIWCGGMKTLLPRLARASVRRQATDAFFYPLRATTTWPGIRRRCGYFRDSLALAT